MKRLILTFAGVIVFALIVDARADEASQRAIVEDLLQTMKVDQMMSPLFRQVRSMMEQKFVQMGAPQEMRPILKRYTDKLIGIMEEALNWQSLKGDITKIYAEAFTEEELKGMLEFYRSPVGQSVIGKMPAVMQQSMLISQKRMPDLQQKIRKISEELAQEIKEEMEKSSQDKALKKSSGTYSGSRGVYAPPAPPPPPAGLFTKQSFQECPQRERRGPLAQEFLIPVSDRNYDGTGTGAREGMV